MRLDSDTQMEPITKEELQRLSTDGNLEVMLITLRRNAIFEARGLRATKLRSRLPDDYLASEEMRLVEKVKEMFVDCKVSTETEGSMRYIVVDWS